MHVTHGTTPFPLATRFLAREEDPLSAARHKLADSPRSRGENTRENIIATRETEEFSNRAWDDSGTR